MSRRNRADGQANREDTITNALLSYLEIKVGSARVGYRYRTTEGSCRHSTTHYPLYSSRRFCITPFISDLCGPAVRGADRKGANYGDLGRKLSTMMSFGYGCVFGPTRQDVCVVNQSDSRIRYALRI